MAINIKFDLAGNPEPPTILLGSRNGKIFGQLAVNQESIDVSDKFNDVSEFSFTLNKYYFDEKEKINKITNLWDKVVNFKLVYCKEWDMWFEITVETDEETETVKTVFCKQLGQSELSQIKLYNIHINEEGDSNWNKNNETYKRTILYDDENTDVSLLHRLFKDKAPHYSIKYVSPTIRSIMRTFSFDGTSIYDALMKIAEEIGCIIIFHSNMGEDDKINRSISVYDLQQNCEDCGHRGEFTDVCPECGKTNIKYGYGEDTTIFVTSDELASAGIQLTSNTDEVKNCFKIEGGDDLITATVRNCNPNGTDYIWRFSEDMKSDMSDELVYGLKEYDEYYKCCRDEYVSELDKDLFDSYNSLIEKYKDIYNKDSSKCLSCNYKDDDFVGDCPECGSSNTFIKDKLKPIVNDSTEEDKRIVKGYSNLTSVYYDVIDFGLYLESSMMPAIDIALKTTAEEQASLLTSESLSPVAVLDIKNISVGSAENAVLSMAKTMVKATYKLQVKTSKELVDNNNGTKTWSGYFTITNYSDDTDEFKTDVISVVINDDYEAFVKQEIEKALNKEDSEDISISGLFKKELIVLDRKLAKLNAEIDVLNNEIDKDPYNQELILQLRNLEELKLKLIMSIEEGNKFEGEFYDDLKLYALNPLKSFYEACQTCITILTEQETGNKNKKPDLYKLLYEPYFEKLIAIEHEIKVRQDEVNIVNGEYVTQLDDNKKEVLVLVKDGLKQNIEKCRNIIQNELNLENRLGNELWVEFCSYRREDKYTNDNYKSDGLNNAELFKKSMELFKVAEDEIYKASELQHQISTTLNNLLAIPKFKKLIKFFQVGNWIRIEVDDIVYKLRLLEYGVNFGDFDNIPVEFSDVTKIKNGITDVESTLSQASSMASSYSYVKRQASQGEKSNATLTNWVENGLSATNTKIVSGYDENILLDKNGILCRYYNPITERYDDEQIKIFKSTIAITDDNWETIKTAVGRYYYTDPITGEEKMAYGVNGETIVGKFILGENLSIQNKSGQMVFDGDGLTVTSGTDNDGDGINDGKMTFNENGFIVEHGKNSVTISPKDSKVINIKINDEEVFLINDDGELRVNGSIMARSLELGTGVKIESGVIEDLKLVAITGKYSDLEDEPTKLSDFDNDEGFVTNSVDNLTNYYKKTETNNLLNSKVDSDDLSKVATSGSYNDLSDTPSLSTIATTGSYNDLVDIEELKNWVLEQIRLSVNN